jgi:protein SCO1/2
MNHTLRLAARGKKQFRREGDSHPVIRPREINTLHDATGDCPRPEYFHHGLLAVSPRAWIAGPLLAVLLIGLPGCATSTSVESAAQDSAAGAEQRYQLRGKIVSLDAENKVATIEHEEIVGWMGAMTMGFWVKEDADWQKLAVGRQIEATVFVNDEGYHVGEVKVTGDEASQPAEGAKEQP